MAEMYAEGGEVSSVRKHNDEWYETVLFLANVKGDGQWITLMSKSALPWAIPGQRVIVTVMPDLLHG